MRLEKLRVQGFQSFGDSGSIEFGEGINLIIGQNNAGKSALLRAMLPLLPDDRHRTPEQWESFRLPLPKVDFTLSLSGSEVRDWILREGARTHFPVHINQVQNVAPFMEAVFTVSQISFSVSRSPGAGFTAAYPSHGMFKAEPGEERTSALLIPVNGQLEVQPQFSGQDTLPQLLWAAWNGDMFYFTAERMMVGEAPAGHAVRLSANANNLPNVLHTLINERGDVFQRLLRHVRDVFPTVGNLSVRTMPGNANVLEIRVWPTEAMERVELSFPLNSGGTGVAQVIALLTAIMTIDNAVILIDEINSFLHPAAVKALLRIIQTEYRQHQYIVSTHAPEVIGFSNPTTIHLVKRSRYESSVEALDLSDVATFREVAEHLGVSMADVFAAEQVIWVEGPTEELCFPYIYQQMIGPLPKGTIVTSVAATGDFNSNKRDPALVYEVYSRLSAAAATLVVSVAFSFDTEKLTDAEKAALQSKANGMLHFLPRRHLECYMIDSAAIAAFIARKDPESAAIAPEDVAQALKVAAVTQPFFIQQWADDLENEGWLTYVNAAKLIANVCSTLSEHRAPFAKKDDTLFLLQHMLEHNRIRLEPLRDYIHHLVAAVTP